MIKKELSDTDLVILIKAGSKYAEHILYTRYLQKARELAKTYVNKYRDFHFDLDEITMIALEATPKAISSYNETSTFYTYWNVCASHDIISYLGHNLEYVIQSKKMRLDLDSNCYEDNDVYQLHDVVGKEDEDIDDGLKQLLQSYIYSPKSNLTEDEALVAHLLYYRQFGIKEIVEFTGWNRDKVNYVLKKTKAKIASFLKQRYF